MQKLSSLLVLVSIVIAGVWGCVNSKDMSSSRGSNQDKILKEAIREIEISEREAETEIERQEKSIRDAEEEIERALESGDNIEYEEGYRYEDEEKVEDENEEEDRYEDE